MAWFENLWGRKGKKDATNDENLQVENCVQGFWKKYKQSPIICLNH